MPARTIARTRTRLEPEARQTQILDHAARLVTEEGLSGFSMERVARDAGVSKALVYTYFSNQAHLLKSLLKRDLERIQREQMHAAMSARTFPELVRNTTHIALLEAENRGAFVRRLLNEPSLVEEVGAVRTSEHTTNVRYLAKRLAKEFDISRTDALRLTEIGLGLTMAAGDYLQTGAASRSEVEELTVAMIIGAVRAGAAQCRRSGRRERQGRRASD
ncbi:MAG: HTH-type transcriptional regulator AcrR [Pseudomonadota bacterium]|jgi:AcrR family transcriptional regulator